MSKRLRDILRETEAFGWSPKKTEVVFTKDFDLAQEGDLRAYKVRVVVSKYRFNEAEWWKARETVYGVGEKSLQLFTELKEEDKVTVKDCVARVLVMLADSVEDWLQFGLRKEAGEALRVEAHLILADLQCDVFDAELTSADMKVLAERARQTQAEVERLNRGAKEALATVSGDQ